MTSRRRDLFAVLWSVLLGLHLVGCPHPGAVPEAWWDTGATPPGRVDSGPADGSTVDVHALDAPVRDAPDQDAGTAEAGGADTGTTTADAASPPDAVSAADSAASDAGFHHPADWVPPSQHGAAAMLGTMDCTLCHGADLAGRDDALSCDTCHSLIDPGWRTRCVFCHGGSDNPSGAPPHDLRHNVMISAPGVGAHSVHLAAATHQAVACEDCHRVPVDATSAGHMFDDTPGLAEVSLGGLGAGGRFDGTGCTAVYCHGNGQVAGSIGDFTRFLDSCTACHPASASTASQQATMSGGHARHLQRGAVCSACHAQVVDDGAAFVEPTLHVNGLPDVELGTGTYDQGTGDCTTACHLTGNPKNWIAGGAHPAGWIQESQHGLATVEGRMDCTACHGADLTGGGSGVSCDTCHSGGTAAWRTDCTFCHGGTDNLTGAPPLDLHDATASSARAVGAHSAHVSRTNHPAYACSECHRTPVDVLSLGHLFDATPGRAEQVFDSLGASATISDAASATLDATGASCSNLYCHGDRGLDNGNMASFTSTIDTCGACHPFGSSGGNAWETRMSGEHKKHLEASIQCWECHGGVVAQTGSNAIVNPDLHVNGTADVALAHGTWSRPSCLAVNCHGKDHGGSMSW